MMTPPVRTCCLLVCALPLLSGCDIFGLGSDGDADVFVRTDKQQYHLSDSFEVSVQNLSDQTIYSSFCGPSLLGLVVQRRTAAGWADRSVPICKAIYRVEMEALAEPNGTIRFAGVAPREPGRYRMKLLYAEQPDTDTNKMAYSKPFEAR